jgi:toxin FitB
LSYLLDTNVLSELVRPEPSVAVETWLKGQPDQLFFISAITWAELRRGIAGLPEGKRRTRLSQWLEDDIAIRFGERLLPIDRPIADRWGHLATAARANGNNVGPLDIFIAATAAIHNLTLVTRNIRDFEPLGVPLLNPWLGQ